MLERQPHVIGITGTIASGKSAVGEILAARGIPVIDTDKIVHDLLSLDTATRKAVIVRFGEAIAPSNLGGAIDRKLLGQAVFADAQARKELEAIVHPAVISECRRRVQELKGKRIIAVLTPLLFEAGLKNEYTEVWMVRTQEAILKERLRNRDHLDDAEVDKRLAAQWSQEKKAAHADQIIDNSGSYGETKAQVNRLIEALSA